MRRKRGQRRGGAGRIRFQRAFIEAMNGAACDGVDIPGHFIGSLPDNFEWNHGCSNRFGLTYVDYS